MTVTCGTMVLVLLLLTVVLQYCCCLLFVLILSFHSFSTMIEFYFRSFVHSRSFILVHSTEGDVIPFPRSRPSFLRALRAPRAGRPVFVVFLSFLFLDIHFRSLS